MIVFSVRENAYVQTLYGSHMHQVRDAFEKLKNERMESIADSMGIDLPKTRALRDRAELLVADPSFSVEQGLCRMTRSELEDACSTLGINSEDVARVDLQDLILTAIGEIQEGDYREALDKQLRDIERRAETGAVPEVGDEVRARQCSWMVEGVSHGGGTNEFTMVRLIGLDDERQGEKLEILWELELGARVAGRANRELADMSSFDNPRLFGAWLDSIQWRAITARDAEIFQAPFRAGISEHTHQMVPLYRALRLPRANLFIADDVGLGKTIESGLIIQELLLRQRIDTILIVAPPSICYQWRDEMRDRFGIHFEIYNRDYIARTRRERGFKVNPFETHNRFIISYHMLRRTENFELLHQMLNERKRDAKTHRVPRSLLVLDEAHTVAPASNSGFTGHSETTKIVREIAGLFENRLFLSATPHNGHSNSFSALLEILDPQRFNRGVPVTEQVKKELEDVMVRRLKSELRGKQSSLTFPRRHVIPCQLRYKDGSWHGDFEDEANVWLADQTPFELELSDRLREYTAAAEQGAGFPVMVFTTLQKRLLSSVPAFRQTFQVHCNTAKKKKAQSEKHKEEAAQRPLQYDESADAIDAEQDVVDQANATRLSAAMGFSSELKALRDELLATSEQFEAIPDAKLLYLFEWIRRHQCPSVNRHGQSLSREWSPRRLIVFTEYTDTLNFLREKLYGAVRHTDRGEDRIAILDGDTDEAAREDLKRRFNDGSPNEPVRILLASPAAREGINLQASCYDLFHYDLPWNPARIEQRNGRIDRQMQPEEDVFCRYFVYEDRPEDRILNTLMRKVETIHSELGSLSNILCERVDGILDDGIRDGDDQLLEAVEADSASVQTVTQELGLAKSNISKETAVVAKALKRSREYSRFDAERLRDVIDVALRQLDLPRLERTAKTLETSKGPLTIPAWTVPEGFSESWQVAVDTLRKPAPPKTPRWKFRQQPLRPVVFEAPPILTSDIVHLHLEHPFVKRLLAGFRSAGFAQRALSGATFLVDPQLDVPEVVAFGRLTLFGREGQRLHDEVFSIVAEFDPSTGDLQAPQSMDEIRRRAVEQLIHDDISDKPPAALEDQLLKWLKGFYDSLLPHLESEKDDIRAVVESDLDARGLRESAQLRDILARQKYAIDDRLGEQLDLLAHVSADDERKELERDRQYLSERVDAIDREIEQEPAQVREIYRVAFERFEPIGAAILWPKGL